MNDELRILTTGIALSTGPKSKNVKFFDQDPTQISDVAVPSSAFNFFSLPKAENKKPIFKAIDSQEPAPSSLDAISLPNFKSLDQIRHHRRLNRIRLNGAMETIAPIRSFGELQESHGVAPWLIRNLKENFKFTIPTPIQQQAIPCILEQQPLVASAPTGSGKTVAYLLPLFHMLKSPAKSFCRALIILPTRELAVQTLRECDLLRGHKKFKCRILGDSKNENYNRLDIGITTPLKLVQLLRNEKRNLISTKYVILDEADKLLEMGFATQIDEILSYVKIDEIQLLFFSATFPENVQKLVDSIVPEASRIAIGTPMSAASEIEQKLVFVTNEEGKLPIFRQLIEEGQIQPPTLLFTQSIERAKQLFKELIFDGIYVDVIHSDRPKKERDNIVQGFREKKIWILICTDLMARGIDFKGVNLVLSWDLPQTATAYIHRVGRTGRAGKKGMAITFFTLEDIPRLSIVVGVMKQSGCDVPIWLAKLKKPSSNEKKKIAVSAINRPRISTDFPKK